MAFIIRDFDKLSLSVTANASIPYTYGSTLDNLVTILTSAYFNEVSDVLKINDVITIKSSDKLTMGRVTAVSPNVLVSEIFSKATITATTSSSITTNGQNFLGVDTSGAAVNIVLSNEDIALTAHELVIKDTSGNAGTNTLTISTEGAQTIDGAASIDIVVNFGVARLISFTNNVFTF
ncbi:hypothetical protein LCGC14_1143620 [marine sediment metagenome]|uniref:Uncharacterized protein n=1 Tax=marine sediment metagenome TaxID=412755 RepID=A0A0F9PFQ8_9ZZZZ